MRFPAVDAFSSHYELVLEFLETIMNNRTEPWKSRREGESYLGGVERFVNYLNLRVTRRILKVVHPIHVLCKEKKRQSARSLHE